MTAEAAELTAAREEVMRLRATTKRPRCTDMSVRVLLTLLHVTPWARVDAPARPR